MSLKLKVSSRRVVKLLIILVLAALLACVSLIAFVEFKQRTLPAVIKSDTIIILGAQVKSDGTPSVALQRRLTLALEAYNASPQSIIACGAQGSDEPMTEAQLMYDWFTQRGVREGDVLMEDKSFNTRENLLNAKAIMDEHGLSQALIVTSDYHVARALALTKQVGISATGIGSPSKPEYFLINHLREGASWIKFYVESIIK